METIIAYVILLVLGALIIIVEEKRKKYTNRYVVTQIIHQVDEIDSNQSVTHMVATIIRFVIADSKEEAIGKFVEETRTIKAIKKFDIDCYKILDYKTI